VLGDEARGAELDELGSGDFGIEFPVEVGQGFDLNDARRLETACEQPIGASCELVFDEQLEEFGVAQRSALSLLDAHGQSLGHAGEAKVTELDGKLWIHTKSSMR